MDTSVTSFQNPSMSAWHSPSPTPPPLLQVMVLWDLQEYFSVHKHSWMASEEKGLSILKNVAYGKVLI